MQTVNRTETDAELMQRYTQFAQRCTLCFGWLSCDTDELATDPNHKFQVVHKSCLSTGSDLDIVNIIITDDEDSDSDIDTKYSSSISEVGHIKKKT
jgi:hypothetical protein